MATAIPCDSIRDQPTSRVMAETTRAEIPKYAAHGIKVSKAKRKCHQPTRQPIGPSVRRTTAITARASARRGVWRSTVRWALEEVAAIVMSVAPAKLRAASDRVGLEPPRTFDI